LLSAMHDGRFQNRKDVSVNTPVRVRDRSEVMQEERAPIGRNVATGPDGSHAVRHSCLLADRSIEFTAEFQLVRHVYNTVRLAKHPAICSRSNFSSTGNLNKIR
jgi:hypothetical protein